VLTCECDRIGVCDVDLNVVSTGILVRILLFCNILSVVRAVVLCGICQFLLTGFGLVAVVSSVTYFTAVGILYYLVVDR